MGSQRCPLVFDHHNHVSLYASLAGCPNLSGAGRDEALALLASLPWDRPNLVLGWHSGRLPFAERDLEGLPPAVLVDVSLHGLLLTRAAQDWMRQADPELLERHLDAGFRERNLPRMFALFGGLGGLSPEKLRAFLEGLEARGVGAVEDMVLTEEAAWQVMRASPWASRMRWWATPEQLGGFTEELRRALSGVKLFTDGALGARTAALSEGFLDGSKGLLVYTDDELLELLAGLHPMGKPLAVHAIGDRAVEQVLTTLELLVRRRVSFPGVRLEHVQLITEAQARRAKALGLTLSMQPNFNSDSVDYADRLSPRSLAANNPFRMLIDRCGFKPGEDMIFGSDGMPHGLEYALQWSLFPPFEGQRLSLSECLAGYGVHPEVQETCAVEVDEPRRRVRVTR